MKKIYFLFLMALLPLVASADAVEINGIYYNLVKKAKQAEVTKNPNKYSGSIVIPNAVTYEGVKYSVTSIGDVAFSGCSGLTSVTIPNSVTSIGNCAFSECGSLTSVHITDIEAWCNITFGDDFGNPLLEAGHLFLNGTEIKNLVIPNSVTSINDWAFQYCDGLTSVTIPNSVTSIGQEAFAGCSGLTSVTIGNGVTTIGWGAFQGCSGLASVTIGNSVTSIGDYAFEGCNGLTSVTIPNSVTSIGGGAFNGCSGLTSVTIGNGVTTIGDRAFKDCNGLTSVHITDIAAWCKIHFYSNPLYYAHHLYLNGKEIKDLVIPNGVTEINNSVFIECTGLTSVTIPNSVTSIDGLAFDGCSGLTSVTIGNNVTYIGWDAFSGCSSLTSITIPNSVKTLLARVFYGCTSLTSATIGNSVTAIEKEAFYGCCNINSVIIGNSVTRIDENAFYGCSSLTSVTIPNNVKSIRNNAFYRCSSLTSVTIGNGIKEISAAFANCPELTDVYCFAEDVPDTDDDAFEGSYTEYATLHVPAGSVDAYKAKAPWSGFKEKVPIAATVKLNKTKATLEKTKTLTLKATVTPSDLLDKSVTWKSSNTAVATVTSSGKVKGVKAGTATITCTSNLSGSKATCKVTIGYVKLDQTEATITKGKTLTLTPTVYPSSLTDKSVTWKSSNTAVATVSSDGTVKGVKAGTATITCTSNATGLSTTCAVTVINGSITLNKSEVALLKGKTVTLKATLTPSDLSDKSVTWKSSNTKVATVSSSGKVTAVKTGTATITCTSTALGLSATCKVTVGKVTLDKTEMILKKGKTETLTATVYPSSLEDKSVTWKSSDTNIATVTSAGKVKGIKDGTVTITCTSNATGLKATCTVKVVTGSVTLDKSEVAVQKGKTLTLTATVTPTTLEDKSVTWTSSDKSIATVSSSGKVKGVKYGTVTITCTSNATGVSATCKVTVGKVVINMSEFTLKKSRSVTLVATVYPTTLTDKSVTWKSSDKSIATVTSSGKVKGIAAGTATITCTSVATGLKGTCTVTVLATTESRSTEGDDDNVTGIENLEEAPVATEPYDVYDLSGRKVRHQVNSLDGLPDGIYIVNGRKILKK